MDAAQSDASLRKGSLPNSTQAAFKDYATAAQVLEEHKLNNTRYVIYRNQVFNAGQYLDSLGHPGGEAAIAEYFGRDVTEVMHQKNHSKTAFNLLQQYKIGEVAETVEYAVDKDCKTNGTIIKGHSLISEEMANQVAKKFDLNKPIFPQILGNNLTLEEYMGFITEPKIMPNPKKQIRIFESNFFEAFSSTQWYHVPLVWIPVMIAVLTVLLRFLPDGYTAYRAIGLYVYGMFHWTFTEYLLHRFIFHVDTHLPTNGWVFGLHFIIHGIHHAFPQDPGRLVFPIFNAFVVGIVKLGILLTIFWWPDAIFVLMGFGLAYVAYDLFHYYTHHCGARYFNEMRTYHMKHHHKNPTRGFGVTSKFWDIVFGTLLE